MVVECGSADDSQVCTDTGSHRDVSPSHVSVHIRLYPFYIEPCRRIYLAPNFPARPDIDWYQDARSPFPVRQRLYICNRKSLSVTHSTSICPGSHLLGIFNMSELGVPRINIGDWDNGRNKPFIRATAIEIRAREFHWSRILVGTARSMERERFIRIVGISNFHLVRRLRIVSIFHIVRQPLAIPFVDLVKIGRVIFRQWIARNGTQITHIERIHRRNLLQMNRIVEIVQTECARRKARKCLVEESTIRWCVRTVWRKINGRSVDEWIRRNVGHRRQEIVHHSRIVGVIDGRPNETTLQNVTPEERSTQRHIVQMQQCRSIRKYRIDVHLFDIDQMRDRILVQIQIAQMLNRTIVCGHSVHADAHLIECIFRLPFILGQHTDRQQQGETQVTSPNDCRHTHDHHQILIKLTPKAHLFAFRHNDRIDKNKLFSNLTDSVPIKNVDEKWFQLFHRLVGMRNRFFFF